MRFNIRMRRVLMGTAAAVAATALTLWAASSIPVTGELTTSCANCATPYTGSYSLLPPAPGYLYTPSSTVESQILNHNAVYTLDTMSTLDGGIVGSNTVTVTMNFYAPPGVGAALPACWGFGSNANEGTETQAVNWSIFSGNSTPFTNMVDGEYYAGHARLDFNVRDANCNGQIYRFYMTWSSVSIVKSGSTWTATSSDACYTSQICGTASLYGQGGKHGQTVYYGDFRMPFQITLSE